MDELKMHSPNLIEGNISKLAALFPNCVTESRDEKGKLKRLIDFDQLRQELSSAIVEGPRERYHLNWPGKREALLTANAPIARTLRPCRGESVDFDTTQNLFIEGDNLDVLKLLQETYLGKVNTICIDPPYNTGNDFIYNDNFTADKERYDIESGLRDEDGNKLIDEEKYKRNLTSNGRFHSDWLSMMYPRLKLARDLLKDDGVIFISIDDGEISNLRRMRDEIFGEDNYACTFIIKSNPRGSQSNIYCASVHEHVLCYVKSVSLHDGFKLPLSKEMVSEYNLSDSNGKYRLLGLRLRGGAWRKEQRPLLYYPIYVNPKTGLVSLEKDLEYTYEVLPIKPSTKENGTWRWSKQKLTADKEQIIAKEVTRNRNVTWDIFQKDYLNSFSGEQKGTKPKTIWDEKEVNYQNGTTEVKSLFEKNAFDFPKPTYLIERLLCMSAQKEDVILDFFAGSATTAHAVMQLNAKDGGNRKFIMVQLPEPCDEKSEAYKAGYSTIAEIGKERIRRAGKKITTEYTENAEKKKEDLFDSSSVSSVVPKLDIGFRVLKIDSSNMANIYYTPDAIDQPQIKLFTDNIKPDRTADDLLFQVLLDWGVDLSLPVTREIITGKEVFFVDGNALAACFVKDGGITEDFVKELAKRKTLRVVFRDAGFKDDSVKINVEQIFKLMSPHTDVKTI